MEEHELDLLEDLFEYLDIDGPNPNQMFQLYGIFIKDMVKSPIFIDKKQVGYNDRKSRHPLFKGKPEGFEHICTRESKYSRNRNFDPERSNKIHWIKSVILNQDNNRVKYFEREHYNGQNQRYFWLHAKSYVVIIREITTNLQLVTAFKVDKIEENRFKTWHQGYKKT
jgi:hypothetical protein